jgi:NAD(P)H-dependent FMN reductase
MPYKLMIITVSTREGRKGGLFGKWIEAIAARDADWDIHAVDLAELDLPLLDEPEHPRLKNYHHDYTKAWSAMVDAADAFIAVTPEYNYSAPPSLINALDHLLLEWAYKPMAFVSYGGLSGGTRSVQMLKQVVTSLKVMPMLEAVNVPFFSTLIDKDSKLNPNESMERSAAAMLTELKKWTGPLKTMRSPV